MQSRNSGSKENLATFALVLEEGARALFFPVEILWVSELLDLDRGGD
jgi:hypothetical protein